MVPKFLFGAMLFWFVSALLLGSAKEFIENGEPARASVIDKYTEKKTGSGGKGKTRYVLEFDFTTMAGERISLTRHVLPVEYKRVEPGEVIDIIYLRSDPHKIQVTIGRDQRQGQVYRLMVWVFIVAALVGGWLNVRKVEDALRARAFRKREEVTLFEVRKMGWWRLSRGYRLVWRESTGREGQSLLHKADTLMGYRPGDRLIVFHGDKRSWWSGDVGDREGA